MVRKQSFGSRKKVRFALIGTLAITSLVVTGKFFTNLVRHAQAKGIVVKDETVAAQDVPEALSSGEQLSPLKTEEEKPLITTYTVKSGDTIGGIAEKFNVSANTIRWANDLTTKSTIKVGEELAILPFSGIQYKVRKGDTLSGITLKYGGDETDIMQMNGLEDEKDIKPGDTLLIRGGEMKEESAPKPAAKVQTKTAQSTAKISEDAAEKESVSSSAARFINPIPGAILTQGLHDGQSVDFGAAIGTTVRAAAGGTVLIAKNGYNGGYGNYIVINHGDGTQTLYGHLSKVEVTPGENVDQGEEIGKSGNSGKSTGAHLHFKVTGTKNPFAKYKKGTQF